MAEKHAQNTHTIHLCKQGKEFQKILDFTGLFRPVVGAVVAGKWKILAVTSTDSHEVFVEVEEFNYKP